MSNDGVVLDGVLLECPRCQHKHLVISDGAPRIKALYVKCASCSLDAMVSHAELKMSRANFQGVVVYALAKAMIAEMEEAAETQAEMREAAE